ncbi:hypothetical protein [Nocardiopsis ganjiahuensis]|uniref:hypothetical protein n=1 Tax=Nocardiopsis ganjiahuensis TaxID=239984 RepID=UPI00034961AC|nr:hypothetical protein [Nocardiopsis ganjiahuensis]
MDTDLWGLLLLVLGGFLAGGVYALWKINRALAAALGACVALAVVSGVMRLGYF